MRFVSHRSARSALTATLMCCAATLGSAEETSAAGALRVASGPAGKIYELMVRDMQAVCGAQTPMRAMASAGGLQNLSSLSSSDADLGIVQVDTLRDMKGGDENIQALQAVIPLHNNLLHVLALTSGSLVRAMTVLRTSIPGTGKTVLIRKFSELKGLHVALVGSAQLLGQKLERQLGYGMQFLVADSDDEALSLLRANKVQAVFTLGGWPLPTVARHTVANGLVLVEYDLTPQAPYITVKRSYQKLDAFNRSFLAVPNVLLTRPFRASGAMGKQVGALQACLRQNLDELQEGRYQSAWKDVKDLDNTFGVPKFSASASASTVVRQAKP